MSDIQEKQLQPCEAEHTPFKMVSKSNGTSPYYECMHCGYVDFSEAIESAKREGYNDAIMFARKCCAGGQNCDYEALIKQSEESE